jgi:hypothetical protein
MPSAIHVAVLLPGTVDLVLLFAAFKLSFVYSNHGLGRTSINCSFSLLESMSRNHAWGLPLLTRSSHRCMGHLWFLFASDVPWLASGAPSPPSTELRWCMGKRDRPLYIYMLYIVPFVKNRSSSLSCNFTIAIFFNFQCNAPYCFLLAASIGSDVIRQCLNL